MKNSKCFFVLAAIAAALLVLPGCENANAPLSDKALGTVTGSIQLNPNVSGTVANSRVALYATTIDYFMRTPTAVAEVDANGLFAIPNVPPGRYFIDAWKDNDGNGGVTKGDFYGVHCCADGKMCNCCQPGAAVCSCWNMAVVD